MFHCQAVSHYQALSHYQAVSHCQAMFHCQAMSHCPATQLVIHNRILLNDASSHLAARLGPAAHWPIPKQENGAYITRTSFLFEILGSNWQMSYLHLSGLKFDTVGSLIRSSGSHSFHYLHPFTASDGDQSRATRTINTSNENPWEAYPWPRNPPATTPRAKKNTFRQQISGEETYSCMYMSFLGLVIRRWVWFSWRLHNRDFSPPSLYLHAAK